MQSWAQHGLIIIEHCGLSERSIIHGKSTSFFCYCWISGGCGVKNEQCIIIMLWPYLLIYLFIVSMLNFFLPSSVLSAHFSSWHLSRVKREHLGPHDWVSIPVPGGHDWMVVPGLEPETTYQFSVLAQNKLGTGPFSEVVTVNTLGEWHTTARPER